MKELANVALGVAVGCVVGCMVASLVVHRNVIKAIANGEPIPEPPAWHKFHPFMQKAE